MSEHIKNLEEKCFVLQLLLFCRNYVTYHSISGNPFIFVEKIGYVKDVKNYMDIRDCSDNAVVLRFGHALDISDQLELDRLRYPWAKDTIEMGHFVMPGIQFTDLAHKATSRFFQLHSKSIDHVKYPGVVVMSQDRIKYMKLFFNMMQTKYNAQLIDTMKQFYSSLMLKEWCVQKMSNKQKNQ